MSFIFIFLWYNIISIQVKPLKEVIINTQSDEHNPWTPADLEMTPPWWPYPEGIWVHKDQRLFLYVVYAHLQIIRIPEAAVELRRCVFRYRRDISPQIRESIANFDVNSINQHMMGITPQGVISRTTWSPEVQEQLYATFKDWVAKWALNSTRILNWVSLFIAIRTAMRVWKIRTRDLVNKEGKPTDALVEMAASIGRSNPEEMGWAFRELYDQKSGNEGKYKRQLARNALFQAGYERILEETLRKWAWRWVQVRILGVKSQDLIIVLQQQCYEQLNKEDFSNGIKPFDDALDHQR